MLNLIRCLLIATMILFITPYSRAQHDTSGIIEYEVTSRAADGERRVFIAGGPGGAGNAPPPPPGPDVITLSQQFIFTPTLGKMKMERPEISFNRVAAGAQGRTDASAPAPRMIRPLENSLYVDLVNKKYIRVMQTTGNEPKAYYTEEDYQPATTIKLSEKTRKIAGYTCTKATVKVKDETFTIWYTTALPLHFAPVNGILPEKGVVLSAESSKRSFIAKKITLQPVAAAEVAIPQQAEKVTPAQMEEIRHRIFEKMHEQHSSF